VRQGNYPPAEESAEKRWRVFSAGGKFDKA
jgi:hypothetical protein